MIRLLTLTGLLIISIATAAYAETIMVNNKEAKIRNGPGTKYSILWKPRLYTPLEVLAKYKRWYAVRDVERDVGWIHDSVAIKKAAAIVTMELLNVRKTPKPKGTIVYQAPKNYTFKILQTKKGWFKVEDPDGDKGWVSKKGVWTGPPKAAKKKKKKKK